MTVKTLLCCFLLSSLTIQTARAQETMTTPNPRRAVRHSANATEKWGTPISEELSDDLRPECMCEQAQSGPALSIGSWPQVNRNPLVSGWSGIAPVMAEAGVTDPAPGRDESLSATGLMGSSRPPNVAMVVLGLVGLFFASMFLAVTYASDAAAERDRRALLGG